MAFVFLGPPGEQGGRTGGVPPQAPSVMPCSPDALGSRVGEESVASTAAAFTRVPSALKRAEFQIVGGHWNSLGANALTEGEALSRCETGPGWSPGQTPGLSPSVSALNSAGARPVGAHEGSPAAGSLSHEGRRRSNASAPAPLSALMEGVSGMVSGEIPGRMASKANHETPRALSVSAPNPVCGPLLPAGDSLVSGRAPFLLAGLAVFAPLAYSLVVLAGAAL